LDLRKPPKALFKSQGLGVLKSSRASSQIGLVVVTIIRNQNWVNSDKLRSFRGKKKSDKSL
jgi:hypothetical protein